jgi:N-acetyl-gamma-glutamyl-phosphate reductase
MNNARVAVFGAGGYTGALLSRLLSRHPGVALALRCSERLAAAQEAGGAQEPSPLCREDEGVGRCQELGVSVALLATPAEASLHLAPALIERGVRVLDLSGAFRLRDPAAFTAAYGLRHSAAALALLEEARYALPELMKEGERAALRDARLLSNPGCYVTAAVLALSPLFRRGLVDPAVPVFIDGKSGASGAGRKAQVEYSLCELEGDLRPYRIGRHQHAPEIAQALLGPRGGGGGQPDLVFVPHLVGTRRGLLTTCHGRLRGGGEDARGAYLHDYAGKPRIHVVPPEEVSLRRPVGTPDAWVGISVQPGTSIFCAVASLDNLLKGAASQAVQNLNAMLGLPDGAGLDTLWSLDP